MLSSSMMFNTVHATITALYEYDLNQLVDAGSKALWVVILCITKKSNSCLDISRIDLWTAMSI